MPASIVVVRGVGSFEGQAYFLVAVAWPAERLLGALESSAPFVTSIMIDYSALRHDSESTAQALAIAFHERQIWRSSRPRR
jgi:hypothetical protein